MEYLISLLTKYGYLILLPAAIVEGPIVTVIAGFLSTFNILNAFLVYIIVLAGDIIGDSACYALGRFKSGSVVSFFTKLFRVKDEDIEKVRDYFDLHHRKAVAVSKVFHGVGVTGLITAGYIKIPYWNYISTCFSVTVFQAGAFLLLGIFFGSSYLVINQYLNNFATTTIVIGLALLTIYILKNFKFTTH